MGLNIVLLEPEIPQNTGNIARTCVAVDAVLHLIEPLGFSIEEKAVRRAGLDYWSKLSLFVYPDLEDFFRRNKGTFFFCTTKARKSYCDVAYPRDSYLFFGKESRGLPEKLLLQHPSSCVRIPMKAGIRSLNLANTVAVVSYEALRQQGFIGLEQQGELHRHRWDSLSDF